MSWIRVLFQILGVVVCAVALFADSVDPSTNVTERALHTEIFRRFAFPPGTFMIFTPELTIPAWRSESPFKEDSKREAIDNFDCQRNDGLSKLDVDNEDTAAFKNAAIQISSPFFVYFDKLGFTHEDSFFNTPQNVADYIQEYIVNPSLQILGVPPRSSKMEAVKRVSMDTKKKRPSLSETHRTQVFHKLEKLLEEIGVENGKACLLRTICELHEFPFETGRFGLFGEVLALILAVRSPQDDSPSNPCLTPYERAEKLGRVRDCKMYTRYCKHSIFHWYWNMSNKVANF